MDQNVYKKASRKFYRRDAEYAEKITKNTFNRRFSQISADKGLALSPGIDLANGMLFLFLRPNLETKKCSIADDNKISILSETIRNHCWVSLAENVTAGEGLILS